MNEPIITLAGNLTADPELRYVASGIPVTTFTVASTPKTQNHATQQWEDGEPMFVRCTVWREYAENVAESLNKGMRVIVTGRLTTRHYEHNGQQRTSLEMQVDEIGPSLRYATAQVQKTATARTAQSHTSPQPNTWGNQHDPWANTNQTTPPF